MGMYKIGDHVIVRDWDDMEREFGLNAHGDIAVLHCFVKAMSHLCGQEAIITELSDDVIYLDFLEINEERSWTFSEGMLRYKDTSINIGEAIDFESLWY